MFNIKQMFNVHVTHVFFILGFLIHDSVSRDVAVESLTVLRLGTGSPR